MKSQKIILATQNQGFGQVGGAPYLDDSSLWPRAPDTGELMTPLATLTERFLPVTFVPPGMGLTVFITTRKGNGEFSRTTQRQYTVHQQSDLKEKLGNGYTRVILHTLTDEALVPNEPVLLLKPSFINFEPLTEDEITEELEDEDSGIELSKPVGRPSWLQDPIYEPKRYLFLMQLLDADLAQSSPEHEGILAEGIGYLYVDRQARRGKQGDEAGFFFIQFT
ncbi:hypothetical protein P0Y43_01295 [Pseudomonas entomophila]|uniref:hypothetical protein n=1 Tax=Pseudomonas entomophila TaxID=312306 RepID=UPI0023D7C97D|nr:hypothetical protein [Pseudomonas entomophila]MDF0729359.1 hypothetical protein [Pseudomonas entomophila]